MAVPSTVIVPRKLAGAALRADFAELWSYRHLLTSLLKRQLAIQYRGSTFSLLINIAIPLMQVFAMTLVFGFFLNSGPSNLSVYVMCAFIPWMFFSTSIMSSFTAIDMIAPLIKRIYFPREIFVITYVSANFIQMLISLGVFVVYRYAILAELTGSSPGWPPAEVLWLPVLLLITYCLTLGASFYASAAYFFFEDIRFFFSVGIGMLLYLVPVFYFAEQIYYSTRIHPLWVRKLLYHLYLANPLSWIITGIRQLFFNQVIISGRGTDAAWSAPFDYRYFALTACTSLIILVTGYQFFNRLKWKFSERP